MTSQELGTIIKVLLAENRASAKDLAKAINVTESYLSRVANGHVMPSMLKVNEIAIFFEMTFGDLVRRAENG